MDEARTTADLAAMERAVATALDAMPPNTTGILGPTGMSVGGSSLVTKADAIDVARAALRAASRPAVQDGLRAERDLLQRRVESEERFKWAANAYAEGLADLVRLVIDGHDHGYPVENGETWEPDLIERLREALVRPDPIPLRAALAADKEPTDA